MIAWVCTYLIGGVPFGITLYATDPKQIERDWAHVFDSGIHVEGRLVKVISA